MKIIIAVIICLLPIFGRANLKADAKAKAIIKQILPYKKYLNKTDVKYLKGFADLESCVSISPENMENNQKSINNFIEELKLLISQSDDYGCQFVAIIMLIGTSDDDNVNISIKTIGQLAISNPNLSLMILKYLYDRKVIFQIEESQFINHINWK